MNSTRAIGHKWFCFEVNSKRNNTSAMSIAGDYPVYYKQPLRWARYHAHNRPHIFVSVALGLAGPILALTITPIRRKYLYDDDEPVPLSYPLPKRTRDLTLQGFDD